MSVAGAGYIASGVMLITAILDWRRGTSGLGTQRLTRQDTPDKFWMAIVLYFNMAFLVFWLAGQAPQPEHTATVVMAEGIE